MGKEFKPIYRCDKCGQIFDQKEDVRLFTAPIYDGEKENIFINLESEQEKMLCIQCSILELNLIHLKITNENNLNFNIKQESQTIIDKEKTEQLSTVNIDKQENSLISNIEEKEEQQLIKYIESEEQKLDIDIDQQRQEEKQFTHLEQEDNYIIIGNQQLKILDSGKFLILFKIQTEEQEKQLANLYGHSNVETLRSYCGRSLKNIYVSTNKYVNNIKNTTVKNVEVINKVLMGVPNIDTRTVFVNPDTDEYAFILKEDFDLQLETIDNSQQQSNKVSSIKKSLIDEIKNQGLDFIEIEEDELLQDDNSDEYI